jgi:putative methyltransferase (TIGR04325 family)
MLASLIATAKALTPPFLWNAFRGLRLDAPYRYLGQEWPIQSADVATWDTDLTVETMRANWSAYRKMAESTSPWDRRPWNTSYSDRDAFIDITAFAFSLAVSAHHRDRMSVLDWGGAFGHYSLIAKSILPSVSLDYVVKERPSLCRAGAELNSAATFIAGDEAAFSRRYDLVVAAGAIHYSADWRTVLARLAGVAAVNLFIGNLPLTNPAHSSFVVLQHLQRMRVAVDGPCWIIDRSEFLEVVRRCGFTVMREFLSTPPRRIQGAPANSEIVSFLLRRQHETSSD